MHMETKWEFFPQKAESPGRKSSNLESFHQSSGSYLLSCINTWKYKDIFPSMVFHVLNALSTLKRSLQQILSILTASIITSMIKISSLDLPNFSPASQSALDRAGNTEHFVYRIYVCILYISLSLLSPGSIVNYQLNSTLCELCIRRIILPLLSIILQLLTISRAECSHKNCLWILLIITYVS